MIAAKLIITLLIAPGNAERGNHGPRVCFVFVREQQIDAALEEPGIVQSGRQRKPLGCPLPLADKSLPCLLERNTQRLRYCAQGVMPRRHHTQTNRRSPALYKLE